MVRSLPPIKKAISEQLAADRVVDLASTFPIDFTPNSGGQTTFFDSIGLPEIRATLDRIYGSPAASQDCWDDLASKVTTFGRFIYLRGGVGAGKTMCGAAFICLRSILDPTSRSLITANTYGQLETSTLPGFVEFCWRHNIEIEPARENPLETAKAIAARRLCTIAIRLGDCQGQTKGQRVFKSEILVLSAEAFTARTQNARTPGAGLQVRSIWADEYSTAERSAFEVLNDRLGRGEGTLKGLGVITSTINKYNPYNWTYDLFDDPRRDDAVRELFYSISIPTRENITLDTDYVSSVSAGLTDEHRRIQLESEYVAVTIGRLINTFDRSQHVLFGEDAQLLAPDRILPLHLTLDFNRSPATASIWQVKNDELHCLREWYLVESDTFELGKDIAAWINSIGHTKLVYVYGDASGAQKTANSKKTNWQIIYDALNGANLRYRSRVPKSNPDIQDSVNALKVKFGKNQIYLNGDLSIELVKDLESVCWKVGTGDIDKKDPARTHLLDGLRYLCWQLYPYVRVSAKGGENGRSLRGVVGV
jgi:hypothetical protein